eukprot:Gb_10918 [translate_table: standard]
MISASRKTSLWKETTFQGPKSKFSSSLSLGHRQYFLQKQPNPTTSTKAAETRIPQRIPVLKRCSSSLKMQGLMSTKPSPQSLGLSKKVPLYLFKPLGTDPDSSFLERLRKPSLRVAKEGGIPPLRWLLDRSR